MSTKPGGCEPAMGLRVEPNWLRVVHALHVTFNALLLKISTNTNLKFHAAIHLTVAFMVMVHKTWKTLEYVMVR